ncbi:MAG: hypothetical protein LBT45_03050 [Rickettsiales bacterium]|jgi:type II restriction enzyme|nr:hypothetical protein [Rickettsiales bacterium]
MSQSAQLRETRKGTAINGTSKRQERELARALEIVEQRLAVDFPDLRFVWSKQIFLKDIVADLRKRFPDVEFFYNFDSSFMTPDGGILSIVGKDGAARPILISEAKNQGTNDARLAEGLCRQAQGNAIERLGKNVIGFRASLLHEAIFPFVCFGYGCDFAEDSSILDRAVTVAMFGKLNKTHLYNEGPFNRGSFYFQRDKWGAEEMSAIMHDIAERSIQYYFSKYGKENF